MRCALALAVLALASAPACAARAQSLEEAAPPAWFDARSQDAAKSARSMPTLRDIPAEPDALRTDEAWRALFADFDARRAEATQDPRLAENPDRLSAEDYVAFVRARALRDIPDPPASAVR